MLDSTQRPPVVVDTSRSPHARLRPLPLDRRQARRRFLGAAAAHQPRRDPALPVPAPGGDRPPGQLPPRLRQDRRRRSRASTSTTPTSTSGSRPRPGRSPTDPDPELRADGRRRHHRGRGRPGARRLPEHVLHVRERRRALDRLRPARDVLRRPPFPGRRGPLPRHRLGAPARRRHALRRPHLRHLRSREEGKRQAVDGHEEIEMALVELFRATGRRRYLRQARVLRRRPRARPARQALRAARPVLHQDHQPFREQDEVVGHAVRALYLYCGRRRPVRRDGRAGALATRWSGCGRT